LVVFPRSTARVALAIPVAVFLAAAGGRSSSWPHPRAPSVSGNPEIMFTFDDGPDQRYTPQILDILAERGIQGMFFWVGHRVRPNRRGVDERRRIARRAVREGHLVGTHTVNHVHLCSLPEEQGAEEIDRAIASIGELTGLPMTLFRAPYGDHCPRVISLLAERRLEHVHWDMDPGEWRDHDSKRVAAYLIDRIGRLQGRGIVLMHDTKKVSVRALKITLDWIDTENERRAKSGDRPITIVAASDWVSDRLDQNLERFVVELATDSMERLHEAGRRLLPAVPQPRLSKRAKASQL